MEKHPTLLVIEASMRIIGAGIYIHDGADRVKKKFHVRSTLIIIGLLLGTIGLCFSIL